MILGKGRNFPRSMAIDTVFFRFLFFHFMECDMIVVFRQMRCCLLRGGVFIVVSPYSSWAKFFAAQGTRCFVVVNYTEHLVTPVCGKIAHPRGVFLFFLVKNRLSFKEF